MKKTLTIPRLLQFSNSSSQDLHDPTGKLAKAIYTNINCHIVYGKTNAIPTKIRCYLCGVESENMNDFSYCGNKGFAHPDCLNRKDEGQDE